MMTLLCLKYIYVKLGEYGDVVAIANLSHGDERVCGEVVEDLGGLRFRSKFF